MNRGWDNKADNCTNIRFSGIYFFHYKFQTQEEAEVILQLNHLLWIFFFYYGCLYLWYKYMFYKSV